MIPIGIDSHPIPTVCPYCGCTVIFTSNFTIYGREYGNGKCYKCTACDAYVGVHTGTRIPLGRLANGELRELKKECHAIFDPVWKSKNLLTRGEAYRRLAKLLNIPIKECHFGWFDKDALCKAKQIMSNKEWHKEKGRSHETKIYSDKGA